MENDLGIWLASYFALGGVLYTAIKIAYEGCFDRRTTRRGRYNILVLTCAVVFLIAKAKVVPQVEVNPMERANSHEGAEGQYDVAPPSPVDVEHG